MNPKKYVNVIKPFFAAWPDILIIVTGPPTSVLKLTFPVTIIFKLLYVCVTKEIVSLNDSLIDSSTVGFSTGV